MEAYKKHERLKNACYAFDGKYSQKTVKERPDLQAKDKELTDKWMNYDNNVYALAVFRTLSLMNPTMVERKTAEHIPFSEVFGNDFEKGTL
jgi:hypothetical protein